MVGLVGGEAMSLHSRSESDPCRWKRDEEGTSHHPTDPTAGAVLSWAPLEERRELFYAFIPLSVGRPVHTHTHTHMLSYCSLQGEKQLDPEGVREGGRETDGYGYLCD